MRPGDFTGRGTATAVYGVLVSMFILINMIACSTPYHWFDACIMHPFTV